MFLTFREIKILKSLLTSEFVEIEDIMRYCKISLRTAQDELKILKSAIVDWKLPIKIVNQRGKGYTIDYNSQDIPKIKEIKRYCQEYLNQNINHIFQYHSRVPAICRNLFLNNNIYLKIESLAQLLHVSESTIAKDMPYVRKFLAMYELKIQSTPYNGMRIVGTIIAQRSCMVDLFTVYRSSIVPLVENENLQQYRFSNTKIEEIYNRAKKVVLKHHLLISDDGFIRLVKYLLIISYTPELSNFLTKDLCNLQEYKASESLLKLIDSHQSDQEIVALTLFILSNSETQRFSKDRSVWQQLVPEVDKQIHQLIVKMYQAYDLDLSQNDHFKELIYNFSIKYGLKRKYGLYAIEKLYNHKQIVRKLPSSSALASYIIFYLFEWRESDFFDQIYFDFVISVYIFTCHLENEYYPTNILLVNENGKPANDSLIKKLNINHYQIALDQRYLYELSEVDFDKYDYMLISEGIDLDLRNVSIPLIPFNFFLSNDFTINLWENIFAAKRKIGAVSNYLTNTLIVNLNGGETESLEQIYEYVYHQTNYSRKMNFKKFKRMMEVLIYNAIDNSAGTLKYLNVFTNQLLSNMSILFKFEQEFTINGRTVSGIHIIFLNSSKGLLEIKNGDSELRRHFDN
ncbi:helix-turn-helix domain-containing protein [Xylocopilactobacillus apicola]|uniref:Mga helix-turn-helix domain-containing protein n=1 Tax=Xylocopilactobacillus apicola TaxID=2932184 RepID=A0AAU9D965_9LACO|nr:helix-turn-helix domain-containing protein [Xylocopilactobacillus apicola]BDR58895.1 hypothetical protein XA3_13360 [Xylocopilactobacillus apicola]